MHTKKATMMKKKMDADCDDDAQNSVSTRMRIAREYDFFERKSGPWRISPLPAPNEVVFPQILSDDQKLRRKSSDDSVEFTAKNPTKLKLFGVDIAIDHHNDRDATPSLEIQDIITVHEKMTTENPSRKRKSRNPSSRRESSHKDSEESRGKTPTKIRLFGVDIAIDHHNVRDATTSREIQDMVLAPADVKTMTEENPSSRKSSHEDSEELIEVDITVDHHNVRDATTSREIQDMVLAPADEKTMTEENPSSRKSSHEDSEELFGVDITVDHHNVNVSREIQDMLPADENTTTEESPSSRNPNLIILEQHRVLLFEKKLEFSDVSRHQNRLLITKGDCKKLMAFLTEEEKSVVMNRSEFLRVLTTGRDGVEYTLHLKLWAASGSIVLKNQWSKLVAANGLKRGDSVQVWGYRVRDELRLEIVIN